MSMERHGGMILTGETEELRGKPVSVPLRFTNLIWSDLGLRDDRLATNRLTMWLGKEVIKSFWLTRGLEGMFMVV
jgi:hypothetical protein